MCGDDGVASQADVVNDGMGSCEPAFGRLVQVDLRKGWPNEALQFTPWLSRPENLALLADGLGMPLDLQATESRVGPFRADLVCRSPGDDQLVLIENQIERTDHLHLGQLITYASGLEAASIVWIASRFTEEHRGALDWLNRMTIESLRFFGLELELWRIGQSALAPRFNVVVRPNDLVRSAASAVRSEMTPLGKARQAYWSAFAGFLARTVGRFQIERDTAAGFVAFPLCDPRYALVVYRASRGPGIFLRGPDDPTVITWITSHREEIKERLGVELSEFEEANSVREVGQQLPADCSLESDWPRQHRWLADALGRFSSVIEPLLMAAGHD